MRTEDIVLFQDAVWEYYHAHGRHDLPWRIFKPDSSLDPYAVVVSEMMLQQTQVQRVIPKFTAFLDRFPGWQPLSQATLADVVSAWSGLGYNRRAKFLWQTAAIVSANHQGQLPATSAELVALPGIGPNTAGAILAYAFNQPVAFIETNIRTVFIHHFFADETGIADMRIREIVAQTVPQYEARDWYWALMDYGTFLKQRVGNAARASVMYSKQSAFHGSRRQVRGQVLRLLTSGSYSLGALQQVVADDRLESVLADLIREGFIAEHKGHYALA
jgi:A/G-specific adenine glycosylase